MNYTNARSTEIRQPATIPEIAYFALGAFA